MVSPASLPAASDATTRILDRAEELFAERGLSGTSIRELAARCGLQTGSLYGPFRSKREIYDAVLRRGLEPVLALIRRAVEADLDQGWGDLLIGELVAHLRARPALARLIAHEALRSERGGSAYLDEWARRYAIEGLALMRRRGRLSGEWSEAEGPLLLCAWFNLIFGYFANARVLGAFLGGDPLAEPLIGRQTELLAKLGQRVPAEQPSLEAPGPGATQQALARENATLRNLLADQALEIASLRERIRELTADRSRSADGRAREA